MRVITHGNQYEIGEVTCKNCECKFAYNSKDIKVEVWKDYDSYDRDEYEKQVLFCPECHKRLTLQGNLI
jgi:hypothetical protein